MKVLVVTATLGNRPSLARTIENVKRYGGDKVKHVIVAPTSKLDYVKLYYDRDIVCIAEPENKKGIYAALNLAFLTFGRDYDYLTYINDDDYWLPEFGKMIRFVERHPIYDVVYAKTLYVDKNNKIVKKQACTNQFYLFNELFHENVILLTQQTTLVKSNFFFKIGGFDETYKLVADTKFWIQASLMHPKYKYLKKYVSCYTLQEGQLSKDRISQAMEHERLCKEYSSDSLVKRKIALLWYRLCNFNIYAKRLIKI